MKKTIRYGICGLGAISHRFLKAVNSVENCEVVACASTSKGRAEQFKAQYNLKHAYTYGEMAASKEIDAVYICNNMSDHYAASMLFLNNRVPVLCEKSFMTDLKQTKTVFKTAKENDTLIMEAMWTAFLPATIKVKEIVDSKELGEILYMRGSLLADFKDKTSRVFDNKRGGGVSLDISVYPISYAINIAGAPLKTTVTGKTLNGVDILTHYQAEFKNGIIGSFETALVMWAPCVFEIFLEKGKIIIPDFLSANKIEVYNKETQENKKYEFETGEGFCYQIEHFNDLIRKNKKESDVMTFEKTTSVMKVLDDGLKSLGVYFNRG